MPFTSNRRQDRWMRAKPLKGAAHFQMLNFLRELYGHEPLGRNGAGIQERESDYYPQALSNAASELFDLDKES